MVAFTKEIFMNMKVFFRGRFKALLVILFLSIGSYITQMLYDLHAYKQHMGEVHLKHYAAKQYYASPNKLRPTELDQQFFEQIPYFTKHLQGYTRKIEAARLRILNITQEFKQPDIAPVYSLLDGYDP